MEHKLTSADAKRLCLTKHLEDAVAEFELRSVSVSEAFNLLSGKEITPWDEGTITTQITDNSGRETEAYLRLPNYRPGERLAVVVCLHGAGGVGEQMLSYFGDLANAIYALVICPTAGVPADRSSLDLAGLMSSRFRHPQWVASADDFPMRALHWAHSHFNTDPDRSIILGYSMGAIATWGLAMRFYHAFSAAVTLNGTASMWEVFGPDRKTDALLSNLLKLPLFIVHGTEDEQIPIKMARELVAKLKTRGHKDFEYVEVANGEHALDSLRMTSGTAQYDRLVTWLLQKRRQPHPVVVEHCAVDENHGRAHWLEIQGICDEKKAFVSGRILSRNILQLVVRGASRVKLYLNSKLINVGDINVIVNGKKYSAHFTPQLSCVVSSYKEHCDPGLIAEQTMMFDVSESIDEMEAITEGRLC
jgi:predicted esterase